MKPCVMVCKLGGLYQTRGENPYVGDLGNGLLRRLAERDLDIVFVGLIKGSLPDGVKLLTWDAHGVNADTSMGELLERWQPVLTELQERHPQIAVHVSGQNEAVSLPDNPHYLFPRTTGIRYSALPLYATQLVGAARVFLCTDPRLYLRETELLRWPSLRPVALLSQESRTFQRTIQGVSFRFEAHYAASENWTHYGAPVHPFTTPREYPITVLAHAHLHDSRTNMKGRDDVWRLLLDGCQYPIKVHGIGWEEYSGYTSSPHVEFTGPITVAGLDTALQRTACGPLIPMCANWVSPKLREYAAAGALPLPFGHGEEYWTYDARQYHVPLDAWYRVHEEQPLSSVVDRVLSQPDLVKEEVERLQRATTPRFNVLDEVIDRLLAGEELGGRFGGCSVEG